MGLRDALRRWLNGEPPPNSNGSYGRPRVPDRDGPWTDVTTGGLTSGSGRPTGRDGLLQPGDAFSVQQGYESPTAYLPPLVDHQTGVITTPPPGVPPQPVGGGLVVGQADHRLPAPDLPGFYVPQSELTTNVPVIADPLPKSQEYDHTKVAEVWEMVKDRTDQLVSLFYADLFYRFPAAMHMFPSNMTQQRGDFGKALVQWVVTDDPDSMSAHLSQLGADHRKFDVEPQHYEVAGAALVSALKATAGPRFTADHEAAIVGSYTRLASMMIDGALAHAGEPASWGAVVVEHQRVFQDFAVLRIQPDAPYPYKAGQYLTLELPAHRKLWRQMSIASAPRADNTFDIHVRSVGASGVSAALVAHTHRGDRLRLGPPRGNDLVVEPGTVPGGLLCVASGTGAAPITAVVESILGWREQPNQLYAYVGGRTRDDIYPVNQLNRLIQAGGKWDKVHVQGVVYDDPGYMGLRGRVENVVPKLQDWASLDVDVLVSGPSPMIATTVTSLAGRGVPLSKIHFDQYDLTD